MSASQVRVAPYHTVAFYYLKADLHGLISAKTKLLRLVQDRTAAQSENRERGTGAKSSLEYIFPSLVVDHPT